MYQRSTIPYYGLNHSILHASSGCHVIPSHPFDLRQIQMSTNPFSIPLQLQPPRRTSGFSETPTTQPCITAPRGMCGHGPDKFSKQGCTVRIADRASISASHVEGSFDTKDSENCLWVFINETIGGEFGLLYTSDFVRFPLLIKYGGNLCRRGSDAVCGLDRL